MSAPFLARLGVVSLLLLALFAVPGEAQTPPFEITSTTQTTFLIDGNTETVDFTVTNNHADTAIDHLRISVPAVSSDDDGLSFTVATATGWTTPGANDTDSDSDNNQIDLNTAGAGIAADGGTLTFTLQFTNDATNQGASDGQSIVVTVTAQGGDTTIGSDTVTFNMQSAGVSFTNTADISFNDETSSTTRNVVLDAPPLSGETITVTLAPADSTVASVSPATLTFARGNWSTTQTVTISAVSDDIDGDARSTTITASAATSRTEGSDGYRGTVKASTIDVDVADDDTANIVVVQRNSAGGSDGSTVVYEGASTDTFTVRLATLPTSDTNITITTDSPAQLSVSPKLLTFTPSNGMTDQTVTVTAVDDTAAETLTQTSLITIAVESGSGATRASEYQGVTAKTVTATIVDDEGVGITVTESGGDTTVSETAGARSDSFTVVLNEKPHQNVVLSVSTVSTDISVLPTQLVFTPSNYATAQTVTVTAVDDSTVEPTETATVVISVTDATSSPEYRDVDDETVTVTITDDDAPGFAITRPSGGDTVDEAGDTYTFQVALNRQPSSNVVVDVTSGDTSEVAVNTPISGRLTFTTANWDDKQSVVLEGVDDALHDGPQKVTISLAVVSASSDDNWDGLVDTSLVITNLDDEKTVYADPDRVTVDEGEEGGYQLALSLAPSSDVTVTIDAPAGVTLDVDELTFTTSNWDEAQTVNFTAAENGIQDGNRTVTIDHTIDSLDTDYEGSPAPTVRVTIVDDDTLDIASANRALQRTLDVERDGDDNILTWSVAALSAEPEGIQVWRATSPYSLIATLEQGDDEYEDAEYVDEDADKDALYIITAFYGDTNALGFAAAGDDLTDLPGYEGESDDDLRDAGTASDAADDDELSGGAIAGIIFGILLLIAIIVVVIVVVRRKRGEEEDWDGDEWDEPSEEGDDWGTVTDAQYAGEASKDDEWDEEWDAGWDADERGSEDDQPSASQDEPAEEQEETAWPASDEEETVHLTCPQCDHDFSAVGVRPIKTTCPNCGVRGVLP